jgi:hypothetical protein
MSRIISTVLSKEAYEIKRRRCDELVNRKFANGLTMAEESELQSIRRELSYTDMVQRKEKLTSITKKETEKQPAISNIKVETIELQIDAIGNLIKELDKGIKELKKMVTEIEKNRDP